MTDQGRGLLWAMVEVDTKEEKNQRVKGLKFIKQRKPYIILNIRLKVKLVKDFHQKKKIVGNQENSATLNFIECFCSGQKIMGEFLTKYKA